MEKRDLYTEDRKLTGEFVYKGQSVPKDRYFLTVVIWIQNLKGEFLLQFTSPKKDSVWATTGGHPKAGESSSEGIIAEVHEELGLEIKPELPTLFKTIKTEDDFIDLYYLQQDINITDLTLQTEEVESAKWTTREEIERLINCGKFRLSHVEFYKECLLFLKR